MKTQEVPIKSAASVGMPIFKMWNNFDSYPAIISEIFNQWRSLKIPIEIAENFEYLLPSLEERVNLSLIEIEKRCIDYYLFFSNEEPELIWSSPILFLDHMLYKFDVKNLYDSDCTIMNEEVQVIPIFKNYYHE